MHVVVVVRRSRQNLILHNIFTHLQNVIMLISVSIVLMIASCLFFASCTAFDFFIFRLSERDEGLTKLIRCCMGLVHTLKCLVLWFHSFISFSWGYQRVMIYAPILLESSPSDHKKPSVPSLHVISSLFNVEGQKYYNFTGETSIKQFN